jgi:hypothetical protein
MQRGQWCFVVHCRKCNGPIPLFQAAPRPEPVPPSQDSFDATCIRPNCNYQATYRRAELQRQLVRSGG